MVLGLPVVLLIGGGVIWALVAFFTSHVKRAVKVLVVLILAAGVALAAMLIIEMNAARIEVVNNARVPLTNLTVTTSDGGKRHWVDDFGRLDPGDACAVTRMVPDLHLREVAFEIRGLVSRHAEGGLACWGDTVVLTVTDNGTIEISHRR